MKINLYTVHDKVSGQFNTPFGAPHDAHAARSFRMEVNRPNEQNVIHHNPGDFALYVIGTFDHDTGKLEAQEVQLVAEAATLVNTKEKA